MKRQAEPRADVQAGVSFAVHTPVVCGVADDKGFSGTAGAPEFLGRIIAHAKGLMLQTRHAFLIPTVMYRDFTTRLVHVHKNADAQVQVRTEPCPNGLHDFVRGEQVR
ncbi:MAG: hypothetical protein R3C14_52550 [Caldilineaceae bacterium]